MSSAASIAQLAALFGDETAGELARAFAGQSLCLPADPAEEPRLEAAIGPIAAACLCEELAGHTITFPAAPERASMPASAALAAPATPVAAAHNPAACATDKAAPAAEGSPTGSRVLDDLASVIGEEAALKLAFRFRGLRLYVPKDMACDPRFGMVIGHDLAEKLSSAFAGLTLPIPKGEAERLMVHKLCAQGWKKVAVAEYLHITERQVYRHLASGAAGSPATGKHRKLQRSKDSRYQAEVA